MAQTNKLNVRLSMKYDTHEAWIEKDPVLLRGEIALVEVSVAQEGKVNAVPSVLMKVGDGTAKYSELNFISALGADVHSWAKAAQKPVYKASEIAELDTFIAGEIQDTDHEYKVAKVNDYLYHLMGKNKGDEEYTINCGEIVIPNDTDAIKANADAIAAVKALVGDVSVAQQLTNALASYSTTTQMNAAIATAKGEAVQHADNLNTAMDARVGALEDKFGEGEGSVEDMISDAVAEEAQARQEAVAGVQGSVDALSDKVGEVPEGSTVMGIIKDIQDSAYNDSEVRGLIAENTQAIEAIEKDYLKASDKEELQGAIDTVSGNLQGETARATEAEGLLDGRIGEIEKDYLKAADKQEVMQAIAAEQQRAENAEGGLEGRIEDMEAFWAAAQADGTDSNVIDTLKEIQEYIASDESGAAAMAASIQQNVEAIDNLEELVGTEKVSAQIAAAIGTEIERANAADEQVLADAKDYADTEIGKAKTAMGEDAQAKADAALGQAKEYADGLDEVMDGRMQVVEDKAHEHANKEVLDGISAEKVAAWDAAEQNTKGYADQLNTVVEGKIQTLTERAGEIEAEVAKKANDADLAAIAKTGNVNDLVQDDGDYILLDCGDASRLID